MIHRVGNAVEIPPVDELAQLDNHDNLVFVGKMSYDPNIIAVTYFVSEVFPALKCQFPDLKFFIVGANPTDRVKALSKVEGVEVTGYVDDIKPFLRESSIVIAPMLTGAGVQNKIIMAMAFGCCVATTKIGAEGLNIHDEIEIINSPDDWVRQLSELLMNKTKRQSMGAKAREYVKTNLSSAVISEEFWRFMDFNN